MLRFSGLLIRSFDNFQVLKTISPLSFSTFANAMSDAIDQHLTKKSTKRKLDAYKSRYTKRKSWIDYRTPPEIVTEKNNEDLQTTEYNKTTSENDLITEKQRVKTRKCCLLLGYLGANYYGMQRNPKMKTIEEDLLTAMLKNNWITEDAFKQAQMVQFQRAARTDKGVSAARQCVSMKLPENVDVHTLNADLPNEIRVFSIKRVTKGFNSKDKCDARTYTYTLPTIALADYKDCSVAMETYRVPQEQINRLNEILRLFLGTKNFHNFTSKKDYQDPSARRYIILFECGQTFLAKKNVEFVTIRVKGQSFMLHQIRKMVGLALAVVRNVTTVETIERSFTEATLDLPMAPGLGLALDQVHYDRYNDRYGTDGIHETLTWDSLEATIETFVKEQIFPTIIQTEIDEKPMCMWLETLVMHSFTDRPTAEEDNGKISTNEVDIDDENESSTVEISIIK